MGLCARRDDRYLDEYEAAMKGFQRAIAYWQVQSHRYVFDLFSSDSFASSISLYFNFRTSLRDDQKRGDGRNGDVERFPSCHGLRFFGSVNRQRIECCQSSDIAPRRNQSLV